MKTRKLRINGMDLVILLVLAAAVCLLLYVFVWSDKGEVTQSHDKVDITYVVELSAIASEFSGFISANDPVLDAVQRDSLGTVVSAQSKPARRLNLDMLSGELVEEEYEGRTNIEVTITAEADVTEREYIVAGQPIYVGAKLSMLFPDMKCDGYCIAIKAGK